MLLLFASEEDDGVSLFVPEVEISLDIGAVDIDIEIVVPEVSILLLSGIDIHHDLIVPEVLIPFDVSAELSTFVVVGTTLKYFLTITGSEDGEDDVDIPMSSFQSRRRSGEPTYLQAVIPSVTYSDLLTDRPNGSMKVSQAVVKDGVVLQRETVAKTSIDSINIYEGGVNQSIVLIGYSTDTYSNKTITLGSPTYRSLVSGKLRFRLSEPSIFLNPGDTVIIGDDTITADVISYSVSPSFQQIEISEA